jgi:hypothetical protein
VNPANLFGIGNAWARLQSSRSTERTLASNAPIQATVRTNVTDRTDAAEPTTRDNLRTAATALRDAVTKFSRQTKPVFTTYEHPLERVTALTAGRSARVDATAVSYWEFAATAAVNTQQTTVRVSTGMLGLETTSPGAVSTLVSTAEMNTGSPTSYGSSTLVFKNGGSTTSSKGTLTGTYTGTGAAANAKSLTVEITNRGTVGNSAGQGSSPLAFTVSDQSGNTLFTYAGTLRAGEGVYLGADIGLTLSFSAGELKKNHEAATAVQRNEVTVDPNAAFNASAASRPKFDNNAVVNAGTFTVNGATIAVKANDTINSVLARIATSGAGVVGFVNNDRVTLASLGSSESPIIVANDTSGFLAATKLAGAVSTVGSVRDDSAPLSRSSEFASVVDGSFSVNGVAIAVNRNTDSLSSVLARVTNSAAGVTATYDALEDVVRFTPNVAGAALSLDQDTSGFLRAIRMPTGTATTSVAPDRKFNATGLDGPGFDLGHTVRGGSFVINGTTITVAGDDTLDGVLARITASDAKVTATFDHDTGKVALKAKDYNSQITVGSDTSGFLAAVKLDATAKDRATIASRSAFDTWLDEMKEYGSVRRGTLTVNGERIAVDPTKMTMEALVNEVDRVSGVGASLNRANGVVDIWSDDGSELAFDDTSGVLDTMGITARLFDTVQEGPDRIVQTGTVTVTNAVDVADEVAAVLGEVNELLAALVAEQPQNATFRAALKETLAEPLDLLRNTGIRGLEIVDDGDRLSLLVEQDELVDALNTTGDDLDLARELAALADAVDNAVATAARTAAATTAAQVIRLQDLSPPQAAPDQSQTSLLYGRSVLQSDSDAMATKPAVKAYRG